MQAIISNIGVDKTIEYITIALSLFSAVMSLIQGYIFFFYLTSVFAFLSFAVLLYFLRCANNKQHTLHMLARDSRIRTLFLLLTYDYLCSSPPEIGRNFSHSRLQASTAIYSYKIRPSNKDKDLYDLECKFQFNLLQTGQHQEGFDILILQPQGEKPPNITYQFDEKEYQAGVRPITIDGFETPGFDGLLWAKLNPPEQFEKLIVTFCLKQVDSIEKETPIIICPFIYVDIINNLDVSLDYSEVSVECRPNQISMYMAPYDGSRGVAEKIKDFGSNNQRDHWNLILSGSKCRAHAIYIVDAHHLLPCNTNP